MSKELNQDLQKLKDTLSAISFEIENAEIDLETVKKDIVLIETYMSLLQQNIEVLKDPEHVVTIRAISEIKKEKRLCLFNLRIKQQNLTFLENKLDRLFSIENEIMDRVESLKNKIQEEEQNKVVYVDFANLRRLK